MDSDLTLRPANVFLSLQLNVETFNAHTVPNWMNILVIVFNMMNVTISIVHQLLAWDLTLKSVNASRWKLNVRSSTVHLDLIWKKTGALALMTISYVNSNAQISWDLSSTETNASVFTRKIVSHKTAEQMSIGASEHANADLRTFVMCNVQAIWDQTLRIVNALTTKINQSVIKNAQNSWVSFLMKKSASVWRNTTNSMMFAQSKSVQMDLRLMKDNASAWNSKKCAISNALNSLDWS